MKLGVHFLSLLVLSASALPLAAQPVVLEKPGSLVVDLAAEQKRQADIAVAIASKTVIRGMTSQEVTLALGAPDKVITNLLNKSETWCYTAYRQDPQNDYGQDGTGQLYLKTYFVRIAVGKINIAFVQGAVVDLTQERSTGPTAPINVPPVLTSPYAIVTCR